MQSRRDPFWDTIKAILICLVVLGHTGTALNNGLLSVIYAFHMPLFVFVSGYFSKKKTLTEYWSVIKHLLIIYLVFDSIYLGFDAILGETISTKRVFTPSFALWYILSLVYWKSIIQFISNQFLIKRVLVIVLSFVIAVLSGFVPIDTEMSFQRTCVFFPFFILGYYARDTRAIGYIRGRKRALMLLAFLSLCAICYFFMPVFYANMHYLSGFDDMIMRIVQLFIAIAMCVTMLGFIPDRLGRFTELGCWTLLIYLLHPPLIKIAKMVCLRIGIPMTPNVLMAIVISILIVTLIYLVRKCRVFKYIS